MANLVYDAHTVERCADIAERRITGDNCDACRAASLIAKEIRELPHDDMVDREFAFEALERVCDWFNGEWATNNSDIFVRVPGGITIHTPITVGDIRSILRYFGGGF